MTAVLNGTVPTALRGGPYDGHTGDTVLGPSGPPDRLEFGGTASDGQPMFVYLLDRKTNKAGRTVYVYAPRLSAASRPGTGLILPNGESR